MSAFQPLSELLKATFRLALGSLQPRSGVNAPNDPATRVSPTKYQTPNNFEPPLVD